MLHRRVQSAGRLSAGLPAFAPLQTLQNKKAKGTTIEEFRWTMFHIQHNMAMRFAEPETAAAWQRATGGTPQECPPIFSFDNPSVHTNPKLLMELGLEDEHRNPTAAWLKLPTYSGDLHRTVERVHARICGAFERWLEDDWREYDMIEYCLKLQKIFFETQTAAVIEACMWPKKTSNNLSALYQRVVELKGGIPERHLR